MREKIGDYNIEWPLTGKEAEWTKEEVDAIVALEYDKGEYGGLNVRRNFSDGNPIVNIHAPYLESKPYNLFYKKTKIGSIEVVLYDVSTEGGWNGFSYSSVCHWVQTVTFRTMKVNNGEEDGYVMFVELENDEDDKDSVIFLLSDFDKVIDIMKNGAKNIQEDWFPTIKKMTA
jgi:hypothetical protein